MIPSRRLNFLSILVVCLAMLAIGTGLSGQEKKDGEVEDISDFTLSELLDVDISIVAKKAEGLKDASGSLTIIERRQILDTNARTLRDVLNIFVPGMDVVPAYFRYGNRVNEGIYSRGLLSDFSQQVLILYNGRTKFNETTFGSSFPAVEFMLENIERIEISRSPSPLYGGSAITIINLITREQSLNGFELGMNLGFDAYIPKGELTRSRRFFVSWGKELDDWHLGASVQYNGDMGQPHLENRGTGGFDLEPGSLRDGTKYAGSISFSADTLNERLSIQTMYRFTSRDAFLSGLTPSQSGGFYSHEGMAWHASVKYNFSERFSMTVGGMTSKFKNIVDAGGEPFGGEEYNYNVFAKGMYNIDTRSETGIGHLLVAGVKVEREGQHFARAYIWNGRGFDTRTGEQSIFAPNVSRSVYGLMVEDQWQVSRKWRLVGGVRLDYYDGFRGHKEVKINPGVAVVYSPSESFTLKGLFAAAARPPSIYESMGAALAPLKGSSGVEAEKVQTIEMSAIYKSGGLKLQVTPFFQVFNDKIEYVPGTGADAGWFVATNNGKTEVLGIDVEAFYYFTKRSYLTLAFSKFESKDKENGHNTHFIPDIYVSGVLNWNFGDINLNLNAYYRGERLLPGNLVINGELASGSHFLANMNVSYRVNKWLTFFLLAENITNAENFVPLSVDGLFVPLRRRTVHAGVRVNFE